MPSVNQPTKIGKYEILSTLGRGGMGVVYKARDPMIDRIVAIKTILVGEEAAGDESLLDRLHMEARSAGRLQHPNIVTVFDFGEQDNLSYIVMEYVEGINLARLIDERKVVGLDSKISILIQIADGLAYAHEHGVVHRDMKPSNVCVTARGTAKILDFGLARFDNTRLTKTGYMAGTIAYMSPERLSGTTGAKDDIFALGAIAYELLTYKRAFPGSMAPEVISKIIAPNPPASPSEVAAVPAGLDPIVLKALAKEVDGRYDSAAEFANDLRQFMHSEELEQYLTSERAATIEKSQSEFIDNRPSAVNVYVGPSSARGPATPPPTMRIDVSSEPTRIEAPSTAIVSDVKAAGTHTEPEALATSSGAPTQIVAAQPKRAPWGIVAAAAVVIALIGGYFMFRRPAPVPEKQAVAAKPAPKPLPPSTTITVNDPRAEQDELQLATAKSLSEELERRTLNREETLRLSEAKGRIALADRKLREKDYEAVARLIADSIAGLQSVMTMSDKRMQETAKPAVQHPLEKPQPRPVPMTAAVTSPPVQPVPIPVTKSQPVTPAVTETHAPAVAAERPREDPEKEVTAFMRQLAAAYQSKDVGFFRERAIQFNDQLASAIRNSPSTRVELQIVKIDLRDPQHASVQVRRTDWFPDPNTPPGVQILVYHVERDGGAWKLASISRQ